MKDVRKSCCWGLVRNLWNVRALALDSRLGIPRFAGGIGFRERYLDADLCAGASAKNGGDHFWFGGPRHVPGPAASTRTPAGSNDMRTLTAAGRPMLKMMKNRWQQALRRIQLTDWGEWGGVNSVAKEGQGGGGLGERGLWAPFQFCFSCFVFSIILLFHFSFRCK